MNDSAFVIFIIFGVIWIVMAAAAVIAVMKADGQKIRLSKTALMVVIPIIVPIILTLAYAALRGTF
ncbi:hypothetical protein [Richelia sinica]|nr:hypothetical protein [Richelia sinica]MBD2665279.1 hypothetical protein [Richelia sinica FACHB-800]